MKAMETIQRRISVRTYSDRSVEEETRNRLQELFLVYRTGPYGNPVRFKLLDLEAVSSQELRRLGTYGVIRGARLYILGSVKEQAGCQADLGYCLEKIILEATALGLGTCWLGGTFRRSSFARQIQLQDDELIPAITPVGYPAKSVAIPDRLLRAGARSRWRKPWSELFLAGDSQAPLPEEEAGEYRLPLEAVRQGPSASNRQPWRIVKDPEGRYRLYLKENKLYNRASGKIRIQYIDMGIAMSHFELVAQEQGLSGRWNPFAPAYNVKGLEHIALWESYNRRPNSRPVSLYKGCSVVM
ncbi:MAG TPA: nitroreductase [Firmicutes bacterium]|nr:nitroreductase [Bacillota bacterium]